MKSWTSLCTYLGMQVGISDHGHLFIFKYNFFIFFLLMLPIGFYGSRATGWAPCLPQFAIVHCTLTLTLLIILIYILIWLPFHLHLKYMFISCKHCNLVDYVILRIKGKDTVKYFRQKKKVRISIQILKNFKAHHIVKKFKRKAKPKNLPTKIVKKQS